MQTTSAAAILLTTFLLAGCGDKTGGGEAENANAATQDVAAQAKPADVVDAVGDASHLAPTGSSAEAFAPVGWRVEQSVTGDISRDGIPDLAFVLRKTDPAGIISRDGYEPEDTNPRILGVAIGGANGFVLAGQNGRLIPSRDADGLNMSDPFDDGLSISNGSLVVRVDLFMNMGGSDTGPYSFRFRHQDGAVRLIGYDHMNVQRMSGDTRNVSVNLLTGRVTTATGTIESDKEKTFVSSTATRSISLSEVGDAFAFETSQLNLPE